MGRETGRWDKGEIEKRRANLEERSRSIFVDNDAARVVLDYVDDLLALIKKMSEDQENQRRYFEEREKSLKEQYEGLVPRNELREKLVLALAGKLDLETISDHRFDGVADGVVRFADAILNRMRKTHQRERMNLLFYGKDKKLIYAYGFSPEDISSEDSIQLRQPIPLPEGTDTIGLAKVRP